MHISSTLITYIKKHEKYPVSIFLLLFIVGIIFLFFQPSLFEKAWGNWIEFYLAFSTLIFAGFIWWTQLKKAHRKSLPKKLNIIYRYNQKQWEIKNAPLTDESDIRAWGQSIGNAIFNESGFFKFKSFRIDPPIELNDKTVFNLVIFLDEEFQKAALYQAIYADDGILLTEL